jgi:hypothetical protein
MISANDLDRPGNLLQRRVVEGGIQNFKCVGKCCSLFWRDASPALACQQRIENFNRPEGRYEHCSPDCSRSSTLIDDSFCSSGKHHDKVTDASTTIRFKDAPPGAVHGLSYRRAKDDAFFRSS